jgi:hypothetical protein
VAAGEREVRFASNALKHGVFSNTVVLPTEDPAEFKKLHTELVAELQPSGSLEQDAVFTIAKLTWRKQRLSVFRQAEAADTTLEVLRMPPPIGVDKVASEYREYCENQSDEEIRSTAINTILELHAIGELVTIAEFTPERFTKDLEIEARVDAQIDRYLKRLFFLKGMKEVTGLDKPRGGQPRLLAARQSKENSEPAQALVVEHAP